VPKNEEDTHAPPCGMNVPSGPIDPGSIGYPLDAGGGRKGAFLGSIRRRNKGETMTVRTRKKYTAEAVKLVTEQGNNVAETAKRLGVNAGMLGRWKQEQENAPWLPQANF